MARGRTELSKKMPLNITRESAQVIAELRDRENEFRDAMRDILRTRGLNYTKSVMSELRDPSKSWDQKIEFAKKEGISKSALIGHAMTKMAMHAPSDMSTKEGKEYTAVAKTFAESLKIATRDLKLLDRTLIKGNKALPNMWEGIRRTYGKPLLGLSRSLLGNGAITSGIGGIISKANPWAAAGTALLSVARGIWSAVKTATKAQTEGVIQRNRTNLLLKGAGIDNDRLTKSIYSGFQYGIDASEMIPELVRIRTKMASAEWGEGGTNEALGRHGIRLFNDNGTTKNEHEMLVEISRSLRANRFNKNEQIRIMQDAGMDLSKLPMMMDYAVNAMGRGGNVDNVLGGITATNATEAAFDRVMAKQRKFLDQKLNKMINAGGIDALVAATAKQNDDIYSAMLVQMKGEAEKEVEVDSKLNSNKKGSLRFGRGDEGEQAIREKLFDRGAIEDGSWFGRTFGLSNQNYKIGRVGAEAIRDLSRQSGLAVRPEDVDKLNYRELIDSYEQGNLTPDVVKKVFLESTLGVDKDKFDSFVSSGRKDEVLNNSDQIKEAREDYLFKKIKENQKEYNSLTSEQKTKKRAAWNKEWEESNEGISLRDNVIRDYIQENMNDFRSSGYQSDDEIKDQLQKDQKEEHQRQREKRRKELEAQKMLERQNAQIAKGELVGEPSLIGSQVLGGLTTPPDATTGVPQQPKPTVGTPPKAGATGSQAVVPPTTADKAAAAGGAPVVEPPIAITPTGQTAEESNGLTKEENAEIEKQLEKEGLGEDTKPTKTYIDFSNDNPQFTAEQPSKQDELLAEREKFERKRELDSLTPEERKKYEGMSLDAIREARIRAVETAQDVAQREGVKQDNADIFKNSVTDQMTDEDRQRVSEKEAKWKEEHPGQELSNEVRAQLFQEARQEQGDEAFDKTNLSQLKDVYDQVVNQQMTEDERKAYFEQRGEGKENLGPNAFLMKTRQAANDKAFADTNLSQLKDINADVHSQFAPGEEEEYKKALAEGKVKGPNDFLMKKRARQNGERFAETDLQQTRDLYRESVDEQMTPEEKKKWEAERKAGGKRGAWQFLREERKKQNDAAFGATNAAQLKDVNSAVRAQFAPGEEEEYKKALAAGKVKGPNDFLKKKRQEQNDAAFGASENGSESVTPKDPLKEAVRNLKKGDAGFDELQDYKKVKGIALKSGGDSRVLESMLKAQGIDSQGLSGDELVKQYKTRVTDAMKLGGTFPKAAEPAQQISAAMAKTANDAQVAAASAPNAVAAKAEAAAQKEAESGGTNEQTNNINITIESPTINLAEGDTMAANQAVNDLKDEILTGIINAMSDKGVHG